MRKVSWKTLGIALLAAVIAMPVTAFGGVASQFIPDMSIYSAHKGGLNKPEGVACSSVYDDIVVADTGNGRLMKYSFKNGKVTSQKEIHPLQIVFPIEVQMNSKGEIFTLDGKLRRIARLSADGKFEGFINTSSVPDGANIVPESFKIGANDDMYILDIYGARVIEMGPDGKFLRQIALPKDAGFITDLTPANGKIILLDGAKGAMYISSADGTAFTPFIGNLRKYLDFPAYITYEDGLIYVVDKNGGNVDLFGMDGSFHGRRAGLGWNEGLLYFPGQMCVENDGYAVVTDRENNRVQIFKIVNTAS